MASEAGKRTLLLFSVSRMDESLKKGNIGYVNHYTSYFDRVELAYLYGHLPSFSEHSRVRLSSCGASGRFWRSLVVAPFRLWRHARAVKATHFLTADTVFGWWTSILLRLTGSRVVLMPVSIPSEIYASTGRSISGLPIWFERVLLRLTFASAARIIVPENGQAQREWLEADWQTRRKLMVVAATVEEFPPADLMLQLASPSQRQKSEEGRLLYVGRLHPEKLVDGLVPLMAYLRRANVPARLRIAGDGPLRATLEAHAARIGVADSIDWLGFISGDALAEEYRSATVFVSTVTGTALREAGLAGLAIAGYNSDWVKKLLVDGQTALLAPTGDVERLGEQVARLLVDDELRRSIAARFRAIAQERWNPAKIPGALEAAFANLT